MKLHAVMMGALSLCAVESYAAGFGWLGTGISPDLPVSDARSAQPISAENDFLEESIPETENWSPIRIGLGGSSQSTTNCVLSLPYVWTDVYGLQAELLSCACDVYGIQACLAGAGKSVTGLQVALGNYVCEDMSGIQIGAAFSASKQVAGIQLDGFCSMADEMTGLQIGGLASGARSSATGLQVSVLVNTAYVCDGVQVGLFNFSEQGTVVQIGLWNVYGDAGSDSRRCLPFLNVGW